MADFPTNITNLSNPSGGDYLNSPNHADQHANANDELEAVQTKVGIDSSADTSSHDYKIASAQTDIITNASDISDNATDIATNAADIAANTAALDGVEASAVTMDVEQTSHGLAVGDIIKSSGTDGEYDKAQADSAANAEVVGIVTVVADANNFTMITSGLVDVAAAVPNQTAGTVLFLDPDTAGDLTTTEPTTNGDISKPVAVVTTANSEMQLIQMRGQLVATSVSVFESGAYEITFDNGTATRSTVGTTETAVPGATGDTSYTAPDDHDVTLRIIMSLMHDRTGGITYTWIAIDGVSLTPHTYTGGTEWENETIHATVDVDAGETVTIGARWKGTSGTHTITNDNTDSQFNNVITYTSHKRAT